MTWNVKKWRENPISDATWRRAREKLQKRRERERKKHKASAILEVADRELNNVKETTSVGNSMRNWSERSFDERATSSHPSHTTRAAYARASAIVHYALGSGKRPNARKQRASVIDRIDRLEAVLDDRLPPKDDAIRDGRRVTDDYRREASGAELAQAEAVGLQEEEGHLKTQLSRSPTTFESVADERQAIVAEPGEVPDILTVFQLGYLRTTFRLLDKDQDDLVTIDDLRFHYNSQGNVLTEEEARAIIDAVSVTRKGYYIATQTHLATTQHDSGCGELREVERFGFDFPEMLAYCLWRLSTEEGIAIDSGMASGLELHASAREAVLETMFVRFKGLDERIVSVSEHIGRPLSWPQLKTLIQRTRLNRGPFGIRKPEARLLFEIVSTGAEGGDFVDGVESKLSRECGTFFSQNNQSMRNKYMIEYSQFAAFFDASVFARGSRISEKELTTSNAGNSITMDEVRLERNTTNPSERDQDDVESGVRTTLSAPRSEEKFNEHRRRRTSTVSFAEKTTIFSSSTSIELPKQATLVQ